MSPPQLDTTTARAQPREGQAGATTAALHVVHPPELCRALPLDEAPLVVGRASGGGGMAIEHGTISRSHARLQWSAAQGAHLLVDLGSRNGTLVDGVAAGEQPRRLVNGSLVRLGDVLAVYEQGGVPGHEAAPAASQEAIPGACAAIRRLRATVARAAADPAPALIIGETGTGKERIARELHNLGGRRGPLVALNCATLGAQIVESQLFGHLKGAFTGASEAQPGLFRAAQGGTLFLDEIGDLPPELQPKLLRVLQEGEVLPVGGTQPVRIDVRVVAATHRDLGRMATEGSFRQDLYARLAMWQLDVPPLRARRIDLLGWIDRLRTVWANKRGLGETTPLRFETDAAETLLRHSWPLNLRGLERLVHELGANPGTALARADLPAWLTGPAPSAPTAVIAQDGGAGASIPPTRAEFIRAYQELEGSVHALARRFARDRRQIYRWVEAYGLKRG